MRSITILSLLLGAFPAFASKKVVYGEDNRKDVYQVSNASHLRLARAVAGMVNFNMFERATTQGFINIKKRYTLETALNVCPSETFSQQPLAPTCSGFLIGPDTLVTAGHCYKFSEDEETACKRSAWVFDYSMQAESHDPTKDISLQNVYLCDKILVAKFDKDFDYAIIKLDRKVLGRTPLKFRKSGQLSHEASLTVIGHPSMLPTKIADGGKVTHNESPLKFSATLDTFQGNSGSAVFDDKTGLLEGILIQGLPDYRPSIQDDPLSCHVVNTCDDDGENCVISGKGEMNGEVIFRITSILPELEAALKK